MKLYATITSERASKGQGGNDYLHIEVRDKEKNLAFTLIVEPHQDGLAMTAYKGEVKSKAQLLYASHLLKGKQQKGICQNEAHKFPEQGSMCPDCKSFWS